jgi:hypothetical protein
MDTIDESIELHLDRIQRYKRHIADDFTFPIGTSDASSHVDQAKASNSRHTKLSDLFSTLRPERQPDQTLQARFYEALETRYGEDIQWQRIDLADIEPRATLLLNKHTGEGKLFYLKFENDAVDEVPQLLTNGLDDLKRSQPDLRAVIEKTIVIDDSIKPLRLFEKARTLGIELMQISRV